MSVVAQLDAVQNDLAQTQIGEVLDVSGCVLTCGFHRNIIILVKVDAS